MPTITYDKWKEQYADPEWTTEVSYKVWEHLEPLVNPDTRYLCKKRDAIITNLMIEVLQMSFTPTLTAVVHFMMMRMTEMAKEQVADV
jgi:hypothetical protein